MTQLLGGYRIVESSMLLNGASTTMMLADLGAEVIKVESPFLGDYLRIPETMHMHFQTNKNKRSIALDLRSPVGREVFYRLLVTADAFVTNAPGSRNDRIGIGYAQMRARKPDIVYCQNTGFGASGPYAELPTHGQMMDALAGALPAEMDEGGLTRLRQPRNRTGTMMSGGEGTATGAVYAAMTVAAALAHRERTGEGSYIDISSAEAVIANAWIAAVGQANRERLSQPGEAAAEWARGVARYQWYQTRDRKYVLFCPEEKKFWHAFCDAVDRQDLKDQKFGLDLRRELQDIFWTRDRADWMQFAIGIRIPLGPANDGIQDLRDDPQLASRHIFVDGPGPAGNPFVYVGQPAIVDGEGVSIRNPAPTLGEHTEMILTELGYSLSDIQRLAADHVTTAAEFRADHIEDVRGTAGRE